MSLPIDKINEIINEIINEQINEQTNKQINEQTNKLINKQIKPFYVYDMDQIILDYNEFNNLFNSFFSFSNYFAIKATPNPHILKALYNAGFECFDASSIQELKLLQYSNIPLNKENVFYTSNYSSKDELEEAARYGVIMNFDSFEQFEALIETGIKINSLCFRLNPNLESESSEKSNSFSGSNTKFGIDENVYVKTYFDAIKILKTLNVKNIKLGIHIMPGSNILNENHWKIIVDKVINIMKEFADNYYLIDFINFGGGIGIPYKPTEKKINLELISNYIRIGLHKYYDLKYVKHHEHKVKIYMENGRFITGPYGWFVTNLQSIKHKESGEIFYGLNSSMADLMRPGMYNAYHSIRIFNDETELKPDNINDVVHVVGTLCENNDWFARNRNLTRKAQIGDTFIFENCGAHCRSMGFNYNSKLRPQEFMIYNNQIKKIRRSETFDDIISTIEPFESNKSNKLNKSNKIIRIIILLFIVYIFLFITFYNT